MNLGEVLSAVGNISNVNPITKPLNEAAENNSFANVLKTAMVDVNTQQVEAYNSMKNIATGKVENLQEAIQQIEEAELSLKLGLEVKSKALSSYKQVMAMQV